jgi:competence protein ComEC
LPDKYLCIVLILVSLAALSVPRIRFAGGYLLGLFLLAMASYAVIDDRLSPADVGRTIRLEARVADFPKDNGASVRFLGEPLGRDDLPGRIRLSWFDAPTRPKLGETWQFDVRLRRPRGFSNPGGFDYEGWLFQQAIGATGYVVVGSGNVRRDDKPVDRVSRLRQAMVARIGAHLPDDDASAVVMAVAVGARHTITREQWRRYAATGTSHLMAISGLHIGLAAGGVFILCWVLLSVVCHRANIRDYAAIVAASAAFAYAEISGFAVPARRALMMIIIFVLAGLLRRRTSPARVLGIVCLTILVADPLAVLGSGFKLSFAAVAVLFWHLRVTRVPSCTGNNRLATLCLNGIRRLSSIQVALLFGLFPLTALLFERVTIIAPFVNLLALPIFNFLTVPACLLGLLLDGPFQPVGNLLLEIAYRSVSLVLWLVRHAAELPLANFHIIRPEGLIAVAVLFPALWSLAPPGWPGRSLAFVGVLSIILYRPPPPPHDCLDLHVLDVGQGLALVLQTNQHAAVFDAGPSFRGGTDTGRLVLIPFLRSAGIESLDLLIVSHADQDHAGGVKSLTEEMKIKRVMAGEALDDIDRQQERCRAGETWQWDGVGFSMIHPSDTGRWAGNNASCVLELRVSGYGIVLTGDIEAPVETLLVRSGAISPADIVLVPHHGSRTSSSESFVRSVRPKVAIVSAGFDNRWGFPKGDIISSWQRVGAEVMNTARSGAISYRVCRDGGVRRLGEHRRDRREYWHD